MTRLLVLWTRPHHLAAAEADAWVLDQTAGLVLPDGVERRQLTRLCRPVLAHPSPGDWLCELHLRDGVDAEECLGHPTCGEWLRDLQLLGMRPAIALTRRPEDTG